MARTLSSAIQSALSQSYKNFELLILDDGSTDHTESVLGNFLYDPHMRVIKNETKMGLTFCRNRLLNEAKGEYISILDADDLILPNKLSSHIKLFEENSRLGMVWGRCYVKDIQTGKCEILPNSEYKYKWDLIEDYQAVHSATSWRKSALLEVGGYDTTRTLIEDADMYLKIGDKYEKQYSPELIAIKFRNSKNEFRGENRDNERKRLSKSVLEETIVRRSTFPIQKPA